MELAKMTEADGDISKAADILQELQVIITSLLLSLFYPSLFLSLLFPTGWNLWIDGKRRKGFICHWTDETLFG